MKDRIPTYPNRIKLTAVNADDGIYDLARADEPTEIGTPLNRSTLLKDTTAQLYGLGDTAVPDDVLNRLAWHDVGYATLTEETADTIEITITEDIRNCSELIIVGYNGTQTSTNVVSCTASLVLEDTTTILLTDIFPENPIYFYSKTGDTIKYSSYRSSITKIKENAILYENNTVASDSKPTKVILAKGAIGTFTSGAEIYLKAR